MAAASSQPASSTQICGCDMDQVREEGGRSPAPGPEPGYGSGAEPGPGPEPEHKHGTELRPEPKPKPGADPGPSSVSLKSDRSMSIGIFFKDGQQSADQRLSLQELTDPGPEPSDVSMMSERSMSIGIFFKDGHHSADQRLSPQELPGPGPGPGDVSMTSDRSMSKGIFFNDGHHSADQRDAEQNPEVPSVEYPHLHQTDLDSIFALLEENIISFVKDEIKRFHKVLSPDYPEYSKSQNGDEVQRSSSEAFLRITLNVLRRMKQEEVADVLQMKMLSQQCGDKLKSNLTQKFRCVFEGIAKAGNPTLLNQIYTELYVTEGGAAGVNDEHEVRQIETASRKQDRPETTIICKDIFRGSAAREKPIRTVLTKGVAGIGKTVLTQKFSLDWAEDNSNGNIQFIFPFTFREMNVMKGGNFSLVGLVHHFFAETKELGTYIFEKFQILFILDGLDECRPPLDFNNTQILTDITESTSMDVLLINLVRGNLLPSAQVWITTRPAAANQIPADCVDMVTEVRGFSDPQKEEYFKKRFRDEEKATAVISHIRKSRSLHIMCHIPVFCWITAKVLEDVLGTSKGRGELPKTLTEMYIHFLVVQAKLKSIKYDGRSQTDSHWTPESIKMITSLAKLAFEQLQKGILVFYESDLTECGIDIRSASVYSGVFTEVFKEERGLYQSTVFCFVHLSVQEFLAALHVHLTFINNGVNLLSQEKGMYKLTSLHQTAVDHALQSPNGHLDLFLRFLLGLSLQTNQSLLRGLLMPTGSSSVTNQETVKYIKKIISKNLSAERSINLFHCLNELNDRSLVNEIQWYLSSRSLCTDKLSPAQWSALGFILLSTGKDLDVFDLKKYSTSEDTLLRLMPVVKASNKVLLTGCNLTSRSCEALSSVLSSPSSQVRELDLNNNDLMDSGVKILCSGLSSQNCHLETLRLSGCLITEEGCSYLASALRSNPTHLRELDLRYNHPGELGMQSLSTLLEHPQCRLDTLRVDHDGPQRLKPGLKKYFCELTMDPNTAHRKLKLSHDNRKMTYVKEDQSYPEHPDRFEGWQQLLCSTGLTGCCCWEVEWTKGATIAVTYKGIRRKGDGKDCVFGGKNPSWSLFCSDRGLVVWHNHEEKVVCSSSSSGRIAVYVDCPSGYLSFYRHTTDRMIHLHTFNTTFTEPVFAGFGLWSPGSSLSLCDDVDEGTLTHSLIF